MRRIIKESYVGSRVFLRLTLLSGAHHDIYQYTYIWDDIDYDERQEIRRSSTSCYQYQFQYVEETSSSTVLRMDALDCMFHHGWSVILTFSRHAAEEYDMIRF